METQISVLIVGGSLTGLTTAVLLSQLGVRCIVAERHHATTVQYKFAGVSPRSMEIYRTAGLEDSIHQHRTGDQKAGAIARARNLADPGVSFITAPWAETSGLTAVTAEACDQERLEPILRAQAERLGAEVRFGAELIAFQQDEHGVHATIRNIARGDEDVVHAEYLVAADGVSSPIREALGIAKAGPGMLQHWMNLIFETDLEPILQGRRITSCFVTDVNGSIVPRGNRWLLAVQYRPDAGERPQDFDQARTADLVRRAAGRPDVRADLIDARAWDVAAYVAERFVDGRVFLVGDAAHAIPPTGGFGGNTGIHDAHNLAWKLAFVLRGMAGPALLGTYDVERRFVAERTLAQALARLAAWFQDPGKRLPPPEPIVDDLWVIFGQAYPTGAFIPDETPPPPLGFENPNDPTGRPGVRAPHVLIERAGVRTGIHDLFGRSFVLLTQSEKWAKVSPEAARLVKSVRLASPADAPSLAADAIDLDDRFTVAYGVGAEGAVLVRPDGVIAWRAHGTPAVPGRALNQPLEQLGLRSA